MTIIKRWNGLVGVIADHLQVASFAGLTISGIVVAIAWFLAAASKTLQAYGPISYFLSSLLALLLISATLWLLASAYKKLKPTPVAEVANVEHKPTLSGPWIGNAQADLEIWSNVDPLTLEQAACLWADIEPPPVPDKILTGKAAARLTQLRQAVTNGRLEVDGDAAFAAMSSGQVSRNASVSRANLKVFAASVGSVPLFLMQ